MSQYRYKFFFYLEFFFFFQPIFFTSYKDTSSFKKKSPIHLVVNIMSKYLARSFNPIFTAHFKQVLPPRLLYGFKNIVSPDACQPIIDKLDLKSKYPNASQSLDIIDVNPGCGLLSTMINHELEPKNHLIIENSPGNIEDWKQRIEISKNDNEGKENFILSTKSGFHWETYTTLIEKEKVISPNFKSRDNISDELLIIGNLTHTSFGESLLAQWIMCSAYKNWLQKYGRVKMICSVFDNTAMKFISGPKFAKRNRSSVKREIMTDTKLIAITDALSHNAEKDQPAGFGYDPNKIFEDQPCIINGRSISPAKQVLTVIEIDPKNVPDFDVGLLDYVLESIFSKKSSSVAANFHLIGPGAERDLLPLVPEELRSKIVKDLTGDEALAILDIVDKWPFKPLEVERMGVLFNTEDA